MTRSWDELLAHARRRGAQLRRRRRLLLASPLAAVAVAVGVVVATDDGNDRVEVDIVDDTPGDGLPSTTTLPSPADLPQLTFARVFDGGSGGSAIFVVDADGSGLAQLTPDPSWREGSPSWSPDGEWIAFDSQRDNALAPSGKSVSDVYLMRPDGSDVRRVTTTTDPGLGSGVRQPTWSPDGSQLAVAAEDEADDSRIVVLDPDGSGAQPITPGPGDVFPAWSPDGQWIAFQRLDAEIWVVHPDGSGLRHVTTAGGPTRISWTPDSSRLSFEAPATASGTEVVSVLVADGSSRAVVSVGSDPYAGDAAWTLDGGVVAYTSDPDGPYRVDLADGVREGGPRPATIVVAVPGGPVLGVVTRPAEGEADVNAGFAPRHSAR